MGETEEPPRKRGRPAKPDSEKKKKPVSPGPKKGRGRPKGSKNKPKKVTPKPKGAKRGRSVKAAAEEETE
ncbi:hypothetical protein Anas_01174 [Armadillidium nasatum]|uniref:Uncharacterized protein n=1 Tax=Armadillidium nasatum TaxID=96803 RepID=A0A5N5TNM4_9CRUS|nr:hypothetical protein Anas_01174 [Armadillidium nasatum]